MSEPCARESDGLKVVVMVIYALIFSLRLLHIFCFNVN